MKQKQAVMKCKLKKEDTVKVIAGKEVGKTGRILKIDRTKGRVLVEGLNLVKKAIKPKKQNDKGGIKEIEASISISNVMIMCKKCGITRVGFDFKNDKKTRVCRKCGDEL
ncbi:MAG: 50S ribosomal protein L24 [Spirochaetia bacterium]